MAHLAVIACTSSFLPVIAVNVIHTVIAVLCIISPVGIYCRVSVYCMFEQYLPVSAVNAYIQILPVHALCVFGQSQKLPVSGSSFFAKLPVSDSFCVHQTAGSGSFNCRFRQFKLPVPAILTYQKLPVRAVFKIFKTAETETKLPEPAKMCARMPVHAVKATHGGSFQTDCFSPPFFSDIVKNPAKM